MNHEFYMSLAYEEALKAQAHGEVPVGAVVVKNGEIVSRAYNQKEQTQNALSHAEILAISSASSALKTWRLEECSIYVTLEPCLMCRGAIESARISNLIYACKDLKSGDIYLQEKDKNHRKKMNVVSGVMQETCSMLIKDFFKNLRTFSKRL